VVNIRSLPADPADWPADWDVAQAIARGEAPDPFERGGAQRALASARRQRECAPRVQPDPNGGG
jgi:hypothetical protein